MEKLSVYSESSSVDLNQLKCIEASNRTFGFASRPDVNAVEAPPPQQDSHSLHYLQSALFATILEEVIMEFKVLEECNDTLRILKVYADYNKLLGKKFNIEHRPIGDELDAIDRKNLEKEEYKIHKIENDRKLVLDYIVNTYRDLCLHRSYTFLSETVASITGKDKHRAVLAADECKNRSIRRDLAKQLRQQRNHIMTVNYDTDVAIDHLRSAIEDAILKAETRSRYSAKWQIARIEQHRQIIKEKDGAAAEKVEHYKQEIDHEQRTHQEMEMLITIVTNECLAKIEHWMTKYDADIEAADLNVQIMKNRYQNQLDERRELERTYAKHKELMENWIKFKDDRARATAYRVKMTQSAITVQAWWRGLLVRMGLGPYRVAKKKGGGKKKK